MKYFAGSKDRVSSFYCDIAPELVTTARACQWRLSTATTGMPQTNGVAERSVRMVKEFISCGIVQSGYSTKWWLDAGVHFCFSKSVALVDGDSSYNRGHGKGHFKGERILVGAFIDFMPQPDTKLDAMGGRSMPGAFIGYHTHAGGIWSGDYLVADYAPFKKDCDVTPATVRAHRIKEVLRRLSGIFVFPVAERRRERILKYQDFNAPEELRELDESDDEGILDLADTSDDEGDAAEANEPSAGAEVRPNAEETSPSAGAEAPTPGTDTRGLGLETIEGRGATGAVRIRKHNPTSEHLARTVAD